MNFYNEVYKRKDELLEDLRTLCQIPSVFDPSTAKDNQPFGEANRKALDQMLAFGQRDGFITDDCDGYAGSIDIGEGEEVFGILGHLDVVPVNETGWHYPQFDATLDGDRLYGRGVADDKGPLLAAYYAAKIVNEMDFEKKYKIRVIFGCDEENGSSCVKYYFKHRPYPAMGFTPDADFPVVFGEKAMVGFNLTGKIDDEKIISINGGTRSNIVPNNACACLEGSLEDYEESFNAFLKENNATGSITMNNHVVLKVDGRSAHGSVPERGTNAIVLLCHYLHTITDNKLVAFIDDYFYEDTAGKKLGIAHSGALGALTNNLGILNYEDGHINMVLDVRFSNEVDPIKDVVDAVTKKASAYDLAVDYNATPSLYVDPESELIKKLHAAYVDVTNDHEHGPQAMGGGTYAKAMPNCVAFGAEFPGRDNKMHEDDETIVFEELLQSAAVYAQALYNILKK
ncbi:succinyl-diaminopimelate desuccinylase [Kandleria vitulina]|uniref:dipeptidase PepV n=1 Tax=Kandleria vitulina TaxID=1630 RepID=UPI0008BAF0B1|nr:dipeptidase PepV [Kandleria vitulina]SEJ27286.1 succinyl-diaminopimelate desuccinylase [Kandleria vitulina]